MRFGDLPRAVHALTTARHLGNRMPPVEDALLHSSILSDACDGPALLTMHRRRAPGPGARHSPPIVPIRVGVLSGEFTRGSGRFFLPHVLGRLEESGVELHAYSTRPHHGESYLPRVRDVSSFTDEEIARVIRDDHISVLLDISGHLPHNRLGVFALRAAPIQIAYPRYPCTTGLETMDYRFTDEWADPPGSFEEHYTEKLIRLPGGYLAYDPPDCAPAVTPLPAESNGHVTFAFIQSPLKLNDGVYDVVAATLLAVPRSRLLIHYAVWDFDRPGRLARKRIEEAFAARGVDPSRLWFVGPLALDDHLQLLTEVDIALDSFPYSGQTTTCECLWMGVPVVTLAGDRFSARVSAAILHRAGLPDWVTESRDQYVETAVSHASDLGALASLRRGLRARMAASPVLDGPRVAREMAGAILEITAKMRAECS